MPRLEDNNKYEKITKLLKELPKIDAPSNFETELSRRMKQGEKEKEKESWFNKIFLPKLIPSAALVLTAVIIILLLRPQVDETGKNLQVSPQLYEEKIDTESEPKEEIQKGKVSTTDRQKMNSAPPEVISNEVKKEGESSIDVLIPTEMSADEEQAVEDKIEAKTSRGKSDQKAITGGEQNFNALRTVEKDHKPIEMLKEKIDTTKDSSKYR
jgi:hypothetical protein